MASVPKVRMLAGPNGSGKSTLLNYLSGLSKEQRFPLGFVMNPDEVERELCEHRRLYLRTWGASITDEQLQAFVEGHPLSDKLKGEIPKVTGSAIEAPKDFEPGYFTPILCDFLREQWLAGSETFTFETVMSSDGKMDFLRKARAFGYRTYLYYICTNDADMNRARIESRVAAGGHDVPPDKVASRYDRSLELLPQAIQLTDRSYCFDNSGNKHSFVAEFKKNKFKGSKKKPPTWLITSVLDKLTGNILLPEDA